MYRMIKIHPNHIYLQIIVWKNDINELVKTYEHMMIYCYFRHCMCTIFSHEKINVLLVKENFFFDYNTVLRSDLCMDDVLMGSNSLTITKELQFQLTEILKLANMTLQKLCSNNSEVL